MMKWFGLKLVEGKIKSSNHENVRRIKQKDFKIFADYLFHRGDIVEPIYSESLINKSNVIDIININEEDIKKSIAYIENEREKSLKIYNDFSYETFTQKEIEDFFYEITNNIINLIKDIIPEK